MKRKVSRLIAAFCAAIVLLGASSGFAQQRSPLDAFAITNARIVTVSGTTIERGTVVVRNGLIEAVGAVPVPADARPIDGTGLTVYPGFFDAGTALGLARPQTSGGGAPAQFAQIQQQQQSQTQSNSTYPTGLLPEVSAAELIRPSDTAFEQARNQGFTTALVVPRERIFAGQSALINLAGNNAPEAIVRAPVGLHVAFVPLAGGFGAGAQFPSSLMGTYTALRQMLLDAQQLQEANKIYEKNPRGLRRPDANKSLEALFPVLNREIPVILQADNEREISRALDLANEFKLRAIISGGSEAWKVADRLRTMNVPVLLSLNFPKRTATSSPEANRETLEVLRYRVEAQKAATRLAQARLPFAFHSGGMTNPADFWTNANKAIENGLGKGDALRAMTLGAADIFGVADRMGSIEVGKIANLTVTRGDIFDRSRTFTHVVVDGRIFEIKQPPARPERPAAGTPPGTTPPTTPAAATLTGTWTVRVEIPNQATDITMRLTQQGNQLTGTVETPFGTSTIERGEITAEGFRFVIRVTIGENVEVIFTGRTEGDRITGMANTPQGSAPFSGTRTP